jgi:hypothetical protein
MDIKILRVLLYLTILLLILNVKVTLTKKHHKVARVGLLKKRQESLCPPEYQSSCWCDYINSNNVNGNDYQSGNNNKYDSTVTTLGLSYPSSAIMIDCQFYKSNNNNETSQSNNNKINSLLFEIPKVSASGSSKYKHLTHISYIDLSRTGIKEVPTDAFNVIIFIFLM